MAYAKFHIREHGGYTFARLFSGASFEDNRYCGTLALPTPEFERILDCLIHGASQIGRGDDRLTVHFGPDSLGDE